MNESVTSAGEISFALGEFEGPLDLILSLIAKHKLDLYNISILSLVEQYTAFMASVTEQNLEIASEFIEMAARLVHMKSVLLLPKHEEEAEALQEALQSEIIEYHLIKQASKMLAGRYVGDLVFVRMPAELSFDTTYQNIHSADEIRSAFLDVLGKQKRRLPPSESAFTGIVHKRVVSVSTRIAHIIDTLYSQDVVEFDALFLNAEDMSEQIATFLAVLELVKSGRVMLCEDDKLLTFSEKMREAVS